MRSSLIPTKSGVHRAACFALYRALQRRSRKVFPNEQADSFEKHVKNAFRINAKARSRASICAALNTGYAALEDLAAGKLNILRQLKELAKSPRLGSSRTTKTRKVPVQATQAKRNRPRQQPHDTGRRWPHPDAKPVLDGLPSPPPGRLRRIPTLINANHIPFLRFRKPQSPFLSYVIRKKNDEREKRVDRLQALERCLLFADDEDEWDRILRKDHRISSDKGIKWTSAVQDSYTDLKSLHQENTMKRSQIAQRMFDILREQEKLAAKEKLERRDRRHQAYKARRAQREAAVVAEMPPIHERDTPAGC